MPQIDTKITIGNVVTIGLLLFSMAMAWSRLATKDEVTAGLEGIRKEYVSREMNSLQIQLLSRQVDSLSLTVQEVRTDVKEIKRWVK